MNLNDFFVQLFESEKRAKQRKEKLAEIQQEIKAVEAKIEEAAEERVNLKGQLAIKLQKLSEEELNVKWMRNKEGAMERQTEELKMKIEDKTNQLCKLQKDLDVDRTEFMQNVTNFVADFGLSHNGKKSREVDASEHLDELKKDERALLEEIQELKSAQEIVDDVESEKTAVQEEIRVYREKMKELENQITSKKMETQAILKEKQQLAKKPGNSQNFKRLQQEFEACRRDSLEGLCQALQEEVDRLERQAWQKQVRKPKVAVPPSNPAVTVRGDHRSPAGGQSGFVKATAVLNSGQGLNSSPSEVSALPGILDRAGRQWDRQTNTTLAPEPPAAVPDSVNVKGNNKHPLQLKEEPMGDTEEIVISDDDFFPDDVLGTTSESPSTSKSFPQTAKRVRFQ